MELRPGAVDSVTFSKVSCSEKCFGTTAVVVEQLEKGTKLVLGFSLLAKE